MVSYQCSKETLSLKRTVFETFDFKKCRDLENRVMVPSRSFEISPFDRVHMAYY